MSKKKTVLETKKNENDILVKKFVALRNKLKKNSDDLEIYALYKYYERILSLKFDYIVTNNIYKYKAFANYDDLKQEGRIALLQALRSFNPKKGAFDYWANQYVTTKVKREANCHSSFHIPLKKAKNYQPHKVLQMPVIIDTCPDPSQVVENNELKKHIEIAMKKLSPEQRKIIELNGIKSYSITKISKELKITRVDCVRLLNEAKQNLKQNLFLI